MLQELPCVECVRHREPTPLPTNMTSTAILRVCSGSLAATRKGRSRACHFGTTFKSWCKIFFACGGHQMIFLSRLGPGSSPGRAESQLASELGELPLLGSQRVAVQQLPCPTAAATGHLVERSIARHVERRAALTVAALAAICSAFRRLVCRCTVHCWALCMDCARHTFACGCALCGGWC